ncbi:MAG: hypothetical protein COA71_03065 [SAR86 cluster bacterium]|uniref:DUF403 domain-containing protein n=1 Tax=SAR86 cluster bacterium TaxID=2030880 RepID=A0A2A5CF57_9GAMM|nr:alpha-E domain-containing protein [Gammaproteobacteria bacterium AH-315-E17]PCJ42507.1 MAG: hypothetical protein COA71_03065 [SAR86 cluster bacterium]
MLSSVAERVYWLGRYLERAENSARLLKVYSAMLFDLPRGSNLDWSTLIDLSGSHENYKEHYDNYDEKPVVNYLLSDAKNPTSIFACLVFARENARTCREVIPSEIWEQVNALYYTVKENINPRLGRANRYTLLEKVIADSQRIEGMFVSSMSHNQAYSFIELGRKLERADMTSRLVDVGSINLLPAFAGKTEKHLFIEPYENIIWINVLRCLGAFQAYRRQVHNRVSGNLVVRFLLQDEEFPRAIGFCLSALVENLDRLPNNDDVKRAVTRVKRITREVNVDSLLERGLLEFIDELQISIADIHEEISRVWFSPETIQESD